MLIEVELYLRIVIFKVYFILIFKNKFFSCYLFYEFLCFYNLKFKKNDECIYFLVYLCYILVKVSVKCMVLVYIYVDFF